MIQHYSLLLSTARVSFLFLHESKKQVNCNMSFQPPYIPPEDLATFITRHFPLQSVKVQSVKQFDGYDDRNYYFVGDLKKDIARTINGDYKQFVIKFVNSRDSKNIEVLEGLSKLAQFLHEKDFECPYPIPTVTSDSGIVVLKLSDLLPYSTTTEKPRTNGVVSRTNGISIDCQFCVRVTVFVEGELFGHDVRSSDLLHELGCYVGRMNKELTQFSHSGIKNRQLDEWDLKRLLTKRQVIPAAISDNEQAKILHNILDNFEKHVVPLIHDAPDIKRGYIHSDINCLNIIIKEGSNSEQFNISGLIDYSNAVFAPLLFELGISMAYLMMRRDNPAVYVKPFLQGYLSVIHLSKYAMDVLFYVILGRLAQSYLNGMYTHKLNPNNEYVLIETAPGWELIKQLIKEGKENCYDIWDLQ